jgi:hypothetical protein
MHHSQNATVVDGANPSPHQQIAPAQVLAQDTGPASAQVVLPVAPLSPLGVASTYTSCNDQQRPQLGYPAS